jgi:hypothetical protein
MSTPWDPLQRAYFDGEALDYSVNVAGGFAAAQLTSDYVEASGIVLPTKRRACTRGPDRRPILDMLMVSIDISNVSFTRVADLARALGQE